MANNFEPKGEIHFHNVLTWRQSGEQYIAQSAPAEVIFDLSAIHCKDPACLSLLLSWLRYAKCLDKKLIFKNVPQALQRMAMVCGLNTLLGFDD